MNSVKWISTIVPFDALFITLLMNAGLPFTPLASTVHIVIE